MARFVHAHYPAQHNGVVRVERGLRTLRGYTIARDVVNFLAWIGSPVTRAFSAWSAARKQRRDDEMLWNLAMTDARIMADLSRAMSQDAQRGVRGYY